MSCCSDPRFRAWERADPTCGDDGVPTQQAQQLGHGAAVGRVARSRELSGFINACKTMKPDPDFEDFARDCIRLASQQKSRELRTRLLALAREWMHAAMQEETGGSHRSRSPALKRSR